MTTTERELAYVANSYGDTVSVIDTATYEVADTIRFEYGEPRPVPHWTGEVIATGEIPDFSGIEHLMLTNTPMNPRFTLDGSRLYVPNPVGRNIAIVDPTTNEIESTIDFDMQPNDVRFTPDGSQLVVSLLGETTRKPGAVVVVDVSSGKVGEPVQVGTQPEELELSIDGTKAYLVSKSLWIVDLGASEVEGETYLPHWCYDSALSPDGSRLFLTSTFGDNKIVVVDTATNQVSGTIDVHMPCGLAFSKDGSRMFVSNCYNASLQVVDLATDEVVAECAVPDYPSNMAVTGDGERMFVTHSVSNQVSVVDTETLELLTRIETGVGPCAVAIGTVG